MFDAHKLDISDELKMVIDTLKPHHDKMRYCFAARNSTMPWAATWAQAPSFV